MFKSLLSLFLKPNCPLCERSTDDLICSYCQQQIRRCEFKNKSYRWRGSVPLFAWGVYEAALKRAIASLKYDHHDQLGEFFGFWLGQAWQDFSLSLPSKKFIVVPIPLHPEKLKERGFNQAELIAKGFCQFTGYPLKSKGLERIKATDALFGLTPQQRQEQLAQAFILGKEWQQQRPQFPVLLIDDIYTTGTTVNEAIKMFKQHQIEVAGVVVLATPKGSREQGVGSREKEF